MPTFLLMDDSANELLCFLVWPLNLQRTKLNPMTRTALKVETFSKADTITETIITLTTFVQNITTGFVWAQAKTNHPPWRRCKTCQSLRELDNQDTVFFFFFLAVTMVVIQLDHIVRGGES